MNIQAVATDKGLVILKDQVKERVKSYVVIGYVDMENSALDALVNSYQTDITDIEGFILYENTIATASYDDAGLLTFTLQLPYDVDLAAYIYGIGLIGEDDEGSRMLVSISKTPKIAKVAGIGGVFLYKIAVTGNPGTIIFNNSEYEYATQAESIEGIIDYKAVTPAGVKAAFLSSLATEAEAKAGKSTNKAVTPAGMKAAMPVSLPANGGRADTAGWADGAGWADNAGRAGSAERADGAGWADGAAHASRLTTGRTINGVWFDGSANINIPTGGVAAPNGSTWRNMVVTEWYDDYNDPGYGYRDYSLPAGGTWAYVYGGDADQLVGVAPGGSLIRRGNSGFKIAPVYFCWKIA